MSAYYCCTIGEVMHVALPAGLKLSNKTRVYQAFPNCTCNHMTTDLHPILSVAEESYREQIDLLKDEINHLRGRVNTMQ